MRIVLRPGHGITPPSPLCYTRARGQVGWHRQRPGGVAWPSWGVTRWYEDDWTARFCAELLPALVAASHDVICQRQLPGTPLGDEVIEVGPRELPQLPHADLRPTWTGPRWQLCAAVEGVLQGAIDPRETWAWSFDPQASCAWEHSLKADLYLSVHVNWLDDFPSGSGIAVEHFPTSPRGRRHAEAVYQALVSNLTNAGGDLAKWAAPARIPWGDPKKLPSRKAGDRWGVYPDGIWELRATQAPAVLLELGFASHRPSDPTRRADLDFLCDPAARAVMVAGIVAGLQ